MKAIHFFTLSFMFMTYRPNAFGQGFVNLDFTSANIPPGTSAGSFIPISEAFPGWTGYFGSSQQNSVLYNDIALGSVNLSILGPGNSIGGVIPGNSYTPVIQAGENNQAVPFSAAIAQTGLIPANTQSLTFQASVPGASGWSVSIAGQNIAVVQISQIDSSYFVYGANISGFAGQTDELRFTANNGTPGGDWLYLDQIAFSSSPVPEPGTLALLGAGAVLLGLSRRRKQVDG